MNNSKNRNLKDLLTAPMVAKLCQCDLKTIHNWVNSGSIEAFRTPGRHLRFKKSEVVRFLVEYGYEVPKWLTK